MTENESVNPCKESSCPGACCQNMLFTSLSAAEVTTLTPQGTRVVRLSPRAMENHLNKPVAQTDTTIVYIASAEDNTFMLSLDGQCPNLLEDKSCGAYQDRPEACENMKFGSRACRKIRRSAGVGPIPIEIRQRYVRPGKSA